MLPFAKYQAVGNDFVIVADADLTPAYRADLGLLARELCDRHTGVGADGLLIVSWGPDLRMHIFNADGSEDTMCGNGLRCVVDWVCARGQGGADGVAETRAGNIPYTVDGDGTVTVRLRPPRFEPGRVPFDPAAPLPLPVHAVNTGSTHAVAFVDALPDEATFQSLSPQIEASPAFPERTSLMWAVVEGPDRLRLRIWERGVGETLGCGTGACAAAVVARTTGRLSAETITVASPGGELTVRWAGGARDPVFLSGPAQRVFDGIWHGA